MGQQEILDFLTANKGRCYSLKVLAKGFGLHKQTVSYGCRKLSEDGFIEKFLDSGINKKTNRAYQRFLYGIR